MNKISKNKNDKEIDLDILRYLSKSPNASQREIANRMGLSLGKINFIIKALIKKGFIKIENFSKNQSKINYIYLLTPKGISTKLSLTIKFMKRKLREYDELKKDLNEDNYVDSSESQKK
jgi:EPS-associated MarR family transcriptional regulator